MGYHTVGLEPTTFWLPVEGLPVLLQNLLSYYVISVAQTVSQRLSFNSSLVPYLWGPDCHGINCVFRSKHRNETYWCDLVGDGFDNNRLLGCVHQHGPTNDSPGFPHQKLWRSGRTVQDQVFCFPQQWSGTALQEKCWNGRKTIRVN